MSSGECERVGVSPTSRSPRLTYPVDNIELNVVIPIVQPGHPCLRSMHIVSSGRLRMPCIIHEFGGMIWSNVVLTNITTSIVSFPHFSSSNSSSIAVLHRSRAVIPGATTCFLTIPVWLITRTASPSSNTGRSMFSSIVEGTHAETPLIATLSVFRNAIIVNLNLRHRQLLNPGL